MAITGLPQPRVSAFPHPETSRRIKTFWHAIWMFPPKLNVSLKSFDFDEHFRKNSVKNSLLLYITLSATHHWCNIVITYLWMPLHRNKDLLETKFSSCSLIFFLKQKIMCWTLAHSILCIWQTPQRKLKDNSAVFRQTCLQLVWPIGKNFIGLGFGRNINSFRLAGHFLLFNSGVQHTSVPTRQALCRKDTEEDNVFWNNSLA